MLLILNGFDMFWSWWDIRMAPGDPNIFLGHCCRGSTHKIDGRLRNFCVLTMVATMLQLGISHILLACEHVASANFTESKCHGIQEVRLIPCEEAVSSENQAEASAWPGKRHVCREKLAVTPQPFCPAGQVYWELPFFQRNQTLPALIHPSELFAFPSWLPFAHGQVTGHIWTHLDTWIITALEVTYPFWGVSNTCRLISMFGPVCDDLGRNAKFNDTGCAGRARRVSRKHAFIVQNKKCRLIWQIGW